jgi:hypothetical protein
MEEAQKKDLELVLLQLHQKVARLAAEHQALKKERHQLKIALEQSQQKLVAREEELSHFKNQDKLTKLVTTLAENNRDKAELKTKLNEYIREIDRCIAFLKAS